MAGVPTETDPTRVGNPATIADPATVVPAGGNQSATPTAGAASTLTPGAGSNGPKVNTFPNTGAGQRARGGATPLIWMLLALVCVLGAVGFATRRNLRRPAPDR
jgi:hypothetical protein